MKAIAVFPKERRSRLIDHAPPAKWSSTSVRVRMIEAGVCGTDREIAAFKYGTPPPASDYLLIGHESLGEVIDVGAGVTGIKPGDLVVLMVRRPCSHDHCMACRSGRQDFCYTGDFRERGIYREHGFMTEIVAESEAYVVSVPERLRQVAVLTEPLTIAEKAITQVYQVQRRLPWGCPTVSGEAPEGCRHALVIGAGPVGLLGAMALRRRGFETYVYSREGASGPKANLVRGFEAHYLSAQDTSPDQLPDRVGQIDLVYEAVGASNLAFQVMQRLGPNAVFVFTGVPGRKGPTEIDTDLIMRRMVLHNQVVFGTVNAGRSAYEEAVRDLDTFIDRWPDSVRGLITGRYPMESYDDLLSGRVGGIKNVIRLA